MNLYSTGDLAPDKSALVYALEPATAAALAAVEAAHAALVAEATRQKDELQTEVAALGGSARQEVVQRYVPAWTQSLRTFHQSRFTACGPAIEAMTKRVELDQQALDARHAGLASALGRLLGDAQAGQDACTLLRRVTGDLTGDARLRDCVTAWRRLASSSTSALAELGCPVVEKANHQNAQDVLSVLLKTEKEV